MLKTESVTLAVKIKSKEITGDEYNREYLVTITRADGRDMVLSVNRSTYDECKKGRRAIFDIDVVMEKEGDINNYIREQTRVTGITYLTEDRLFNNFSKIKDENYTWLSRYAPPLKKKNDRPVILLMGIVFFAAGVFVFTFLPRIIVKNINKAKIYKDYVHTVGETTDRGSTSNSWDSDSYYHYATLVYHADGNAYTVDYGERGKFTDRLADNYDIIYKKDEPEKSYVAEYDTITKMYLPSDYAYSMMDYVGYVLVSLVIGIPCIAGGSFCLIQGIRGKEI